MKQRRSFKVCVCALAKLPLLGEATPCCLLTERKREVVLVVVAAAQGCCQAL